MFKKVPQKYRVPISIVSLLLGIYFFVISYTPGGSREVGGGFGDIPSGTMQYYGPTISPLLVILGACCFLISYYFYKNRNIPNQK